MSAATVLVGNCLDLMPTLDADSVDAIVTDPPYGLKFMGKSWDHGTPGEPFWREALRVAKPGAHLVAFGGTRTFHRLTCAIEDAGWEIRDCLSWLYGSGFPKSHNGPWGGTALKPAWEPIILARKPLVGTVAANVQAHGTGGLNIDGCRIGEAGARSNGGNGKRGTVALGDYGPTPRVDYGTGRWPANVCLDEDAARLLDEQAPATGAFAPVRGTEPSRPAKNTYGEYARGGGAFHHDGLQGASRFFYTSKASRAERNAGLDDMAASVTARTGMAGRGQGGLKCRKCAKWKASGSPCVCANPEFEQVAFERPSTANHHPTVKPLDLMQWLCRLVTPKGGLVLDPFCGSGSTGRASIAEGFRFVGIELSDEYAAIARARIAEYAPLLSGGAA